MSPGGLRLGGRKRLYTRVDPSFPRTWWWLTRMRSRTHTHTLFIRKISRRSVDGEMSTKCCKWNRKKRGCRSPQATTSSVSPSLGYRRQLLSEQSRKIDGYERKGRKEESVSKLTTKGGGSAGAAARPRLYPPALPSGSFLSRRNGTINIGASPLEPRTS